MNKEEMQKIFEIDNDGRYINLIIPELDGLPELDIRGKKDAELTSEEVVRKKMYVRELYKLMDD